MRPQIKRYKPVQLKEFASKHNRVVLRAAYPNEIKTFLSQGIASETLRKRAGITEIRRTVRLQDPNFVSVYDSEQYHREYPKDFENRNPAEYILNQRLSLFGEVMLYCVVPDKKIYPATHNHKMPGESIIKRRIKPREIIAIKFRLKLDEQSKMTVIREAKKKGIPVYDENGLRVWPPVKK